MKEKDWDVVRGLDPSVVLGSVQEELSAFAVFPLHAKPVLAFLESWNKQELGLEKGQLAARNSQVWRQQAPDESLAALVFLYPAFVLMNLL